VPLVVCVVLLGGLPPKLLMPLFRRSCVSTPDAQAVVCSPAAYHVRALRHAFYGNLSGRSTLLTILSVSTECK
jgi:hypothetical protein